MLGKSKSRSEDRDQTSQQIVLSLDSLSYRTGSGTSHPVVKERALLSCRKANRQSQTLTASELLVNPLISPCSAGLQPGILLSWSAAARRRFRVSAVSSRAEMRGAHRREGSAVSLFPPTVRPRNKPY